VNQDIFDLRAKATARMKACDFGFSRKSYKCVVYFSRLEFARKTICAKQLAGMRQDQIILCAIIYRDGQSSASQLWRNYLAFGKKKRDYIRFMINAMELSVWFYGAKQFQCLPREVP
jgi:hypothetical protein